MEVCPPPPTPVDGAEWNGELCPKQAVRAHRPGQGRAGSGAEGGKLVSWPSVFILPRSRADGGAGGLLPSHAPDARGD